MRTKIKLKVPTRRQFLEWLKKQPDTRKFKYTNGAPTDGVMCPMCAYLKEHGFGGFQVGPYRVSILDTPTREVSLPDWFADAVPRREYTARECKAVFGLVKKNRK